MQSQETIQQANFFRDMFETLPVPVALTDSNGQILYANKALCFLCDLSNAEINDKPVSYLFRSSGQALEKESNRSNERREREDQDTDPLLTSILSLRTIRFDKPVYQCELINSRNLVHVQVTEMGGHFCFTIISNTGPTASSVSASQDEAERLRSENKALVKKLEETEKRNKELVRSNQDLSQYAYVASHDLQEPLRKIRIFSDILIGSPQLAGKDKFIATKINMASERMSLLIRDLLNYSKLIKSEAVFEKVSLHEILKAVIVDFEIKIQEKKAVITYPELPEIDAVKLQMNQLFYNLLGNALKFTLPEQPPVIEISAREVMYGEVSEYISKPVTDTNYLHVKFTDHGIGFDAKDAQQIFEVFKRLYPREVYEGSGIGLALCRRIVQNHGGYMFADSAPGKGATFNIIVPVNQLHERA